MPNAGEAIIGKKLIMPEPETKREIPQYGKVKTSMNEEVFQEHYSDFCFKTLYIKQEVIVAMTEIMRECDHVAMKENIFKMEFDKL